jgi:hypothetical protein
MTWGRTLTDVPSNNVATLAAWLHTFDLVALGESLGDELATELCHGNRRAQVTLEHADLACILGAAASRGAVRFVQSAETRALVAGEPDALAAVLETVRTALGLLCQDPASKPQAERAADATTAIHLLGQLVARWQAA